MSSRRRAREFALQVLYTIDLTGAEVGSAFAGLWAELVEPDGLSGRVATQDEIEFARTLVDGVQARMAEIDQLIESSSVNWRISRMPAVDRNILRLATYELLGCTDIPASVSINEAIELAKRFGDKGSRAFVNGILDRVASETGRGGRRRHGR